MKFENIEITKDGRVILTVKSGFAFEIEASNIPDGFHISHVDFTEKIHVSGEAKEERIISIYAHREAVAIQ